MMSTTITVAILVALIIGLAFGSVIAGLALMERRSNETLGIDALAKQRQPMDGA